MTMHESAEMYLETIYLLTQRGGTVRSVDVAEFMGYSKPSVSRAVGLLKQEGYLDTADGGALVLTPAGRELAAGVFERHTVLTRLLRDMGVSAQTAERDACRIEHVISEETFEKIKAHLAATQPDAF